jgi:uncharacterized protein YecE (DUF72 family)
MLDCYVGHFDTVELNNSFYRLPSDAAFDEWRKATPPNFVFAVKASRFLTHNKKLKEPENPIQNLVSRVVHLGPKLGPVLFQLPPRWAVNYERLENFLAMWPRTLRCVFELRDQTWIRSDINDLLARFRAAFCIYEIAGYHSPLTVTTDFAYVRLHGPGPAKYQNSYDEQRLRKWSRQIRDWGRELKSVYIYFDNDQAGFAAHNALTLKHMVLNS